MLHPRSFALLLAVAAFGASAFDLQGHRGARGLAPENTITAVETALSIGVSSVELDTRLTADNVVVLSHDSRLNPALTRDATGHWLSGPGRSIRQTKYGRLLAFDVGRIDPASAYGKGFPLQVPEDGTRIPTLSQVFRRVDEIGAQHLRFNLEIKTTPEDARWMPQATDELLRAICAANMQDRVSIESFDWRALARVQQQHPGMQTAYLTMRSARQDTVSDTAWTGGLRIADFGGSVPRMIKAAGGRIWSPFFLTLTQQEVRESHEVGLRVLPWTVNNADAMNKLIEWGVDGIITDYPDVLREVMRARGMALPPQVRAPQRELLR